MRDVRKSSLTHSTAWKMYIADFGIARSYPTLEDSETEGPTMFTRKYAAPEVVDRDTRGLPADIFSLGCVYVEMATVLASPEYSKGLGKLLNMLRANEYGETSYQGNLPMVRRFVKELRRPQSLNFPLELLCQVALQMIEEEPGRRIDAKQLAVRLNVPNDYCPGISGAEPLEAGLSRTFPPFFSQN